MRAFGVGLALLLTFDCNVTSAADKKKPCQPTLSQCPVRGCATKDTPAALANTVKRNLHPEGDIKTLTFEDFRFLQNAVEAKFDGKYSTLTKPDRARLRTLRTADQAVGEGDLVEIMGYIAVKPGKSKPHANSSGEAVNCRLTKSDNNDFHISITPEAGGTEFVGIVIEMIPQKRSDEWTESKLRLVQKAAKLVRVRGQLFFDNHHHVNTSKLDSNQPKRMSLWEIHPVTEFDVCTKAECEVDSNGWQPLAEWE